MIQSSNICSTVDQTKKEQKKSLKNSVITTAVMAEKFNLKTSNSVLKIQLFGII